MKYIKLLIFWVLSVLPLTMQANHLVGGEFKITYTGNFVYDIELIVYADAQGLTGPAGNEDQTINVTIFDKQTNDALEILTLPQISSSFVPYTNAKCEPGSVTTKILRYKISKTLSAFEYGNQAGYYIVWERCCRNTGVVNVLNPQSTGIVYYAEFPPVFKNNQQFINSSPALPPMPPDFLCAGQLYQYSLKATDPDGDQLVYTLSEPLGGHTSSSGTAYVNPPLPAPYSKITWAPGYGAIQMIDGTPSLNIDPVTGLISVRPSTSGLFVFAVTVSEFRNNVKIGEVRRDIQVKINACQFNSPPEVSVRPVGATQDYVEGNILTVSDRTNICFPVIFTDPDRYQTVTIKAVPVNFNAPISISPSSGTINSVGQKFTTQICWPDCGINSPNQLYLVDLIVQDDACGTALTRKLRLTFRVIPTPNQKPKIRVQGISNSAQVNIGETITFNVISTDSVDNDQLKVTMAGNGFNPEEAGMKFSPVSGTGKLTSVFSWTPDCSHLLNNGSYKLNFQVKDNSCFLKNTDTVSVRLNLGETGETVPFLPPNIFTPNNDSHNDFFEMPNLPSEKCAEKFDFIRIYNRWGNEVFESGDRNFAWDGKNASAGVYFYLLQFGPQKYQGTVTLIK